ncbi:MAG: efflux RND transporter periplasmic adaptor subunit [Nitrospirota bacterium]
MNKRAVLILAACAALIAGLLFLGYSKLGGDLLGKSSQQKTVQQATPGGHAGHGGAPPPPQASGEPEQPVPEAAEEEPQIVEIPEDKQQMIGVRTVAASVKPLRKVVRTVGRIEYDERKIATVNTKIEGWLERLYVNTTGQYVAKGAPLAAVYSPELVATQQEYLNALRWAKQGGAAQEGARGPDSIGGALDKMFSRDAGAMREAARQRLRLWDIKDPEIKRIEESGQPIRTLTIHSPVSGYVVQKAALQGMRVMPGERLFDIADLSTVWVIADIYEYDLPLIQPGQTASIGLSYLPDKVFTSKIDFIYPVLAGETRTAKARFVIPNPGGRLRPQMFTNVEIGIDLGRKLVIPEDAVINTGTKQIVYVDKGEGSFEPREIATGITAEGMVEVVRGLAAGEKVAGSAAFLIDSEARLKGVVQ